MMMTMKERWKVLVVVAAMIVESVAVVDDVAGESGGALVFQGAIESRKEVEENRGAVLMIVEIEIGEVEEEDEQEGWVVELVEVEMD